MQGAYECSDKRGEDVDGREGNEIPGGWEGDIDLKRLRVIKERFGNGIILMERMTKVVRGQERDRRNKYMTEMNE